MNPLPSNARWRDMKAIFHEVADLPAADRARVLAEKCGTDLGMRSEIESLLAADDLASRVLGQTAAQVVEAQPPATIGPYRVLREVNRGGMGTIYLAEREDDFQRQVAIKVIRGAAHSDEVVRRFRMERQILANLHHPHIARLLDGGTTADGAPYFVMEYVDGLPIDQYCNERDLPVGDRLRLFAQVCAAVHYAHQNLVVHRDIKPANILITADGTPKLLDFGIAKLLDESVADVTATGFRAMTPEYASPEQVGGAPVTTSTDIYSLGVVLFELLSGQRPYRFTSHSPAELARVVGEAQPSRPSEVVTGDVARRLRGDLDTIVLMALHKDPQRRYGSAEAFREDIERHLSGLPVHARPDSLSYRAAKFIRRNRAAVSVAALLVLALLGGVAAATWQWMEAREAQRRAERRFKDLRQLANVLIFELEPDIALLTGATKAREKLVATALRYLDSLSAEADEPALQMELAEAYRKIGEIQGNTYSSNLGQFGEAAASYEKSRRLLETLHARNPGDAAALENLALTIHGYADVMFQKAELERTESLYSDAIRMYERAAKIRPLDYEVRRSWALVISKRADLLGHSGTANLGRTDEALVEHRRALALREALAAEKPSHERIQRDVAESLTKIAYMQNASGNFAAAAETNRRAIAMISKLAARNPNISNDQQDLAVTKLIAALPLRQLGRHDEAEREVTESLQIIERLEASDPSSTLWPRNISVILNHRSDIRFEKRDFAGAVEDSARAIRIAEKLWRDQKATDSSLDLAIALRRSLEPLHEQGRHDEVVSNAARAYAVLADIDLRQNARARYEAALVDARLGRALARRGQMQPARQRLEAALKVLEELVAATPDDVQKKDQLALTHVYIAESLSGRDGAGRCQGYAAATRIWTAMRAEGKLPARSATALAAATERAAGCGA
jgi:tetratricopeptide (TPR) repeat protein/tRNA A-37 threonylcarbamoyl transferase component Bud32